jgi:hypothetical protein
MAEFRKLIASLLTPTTISATANKVMAININKKILSIVFVYNRVVNILNLKEVIVI